MAKKTFIISPKQAKRLSEENLVTISAPAKGNTVSDYGAAINNTDTLSDIQKAKASGSDVAVKVYNPDNVDDSMPTVDINVTRGQNPSDAILKQGNNNLFGKGSAAIVSGDGVGEGKVYSKRQIEESRLKKLQEKYIISTKGNLFNEEEIAGFVDNIEDDKEDEPEEINSYEEYKNDYPNSNFNPKDITREELEEFCDGSNDYLFIYDTPFGRTVPRAANVSEIKADIAKDVAVCDFTPTHEKDFYFEFNNNLVDFDRYYIVVFKLTNIPDEKDYYVIYEKEKALTF